MIRSGQERLDAIRPTIARGEAFRQRVSDAAGDVVRCADLMAEAIAMHREQRGLEVVGRRYCRAFGSVEAERQSDRSGEGREVGRQVAGIHAAQLDGAVHQREVTNPTQKD